MSENFKSVVIVEMTNPNILGISMSGKTGIMRIYDKTLEAIGNPEFFYFLMNEELKKIAIRPCEMGEEGSFRNVEPEPGRCHIISCTDFVRYLFRRYSWNRSHSILLSGEYNETDNMVEFDLESAAELHLSCGRPCERGG